MNDMLIMGILLDLINQTKKMLQSSFDMDIKVVDVNFSRTSKVILLHNPIIYERSLESLDKTNLLLPPFDHSCHLKKKLGDSVAQLEYTQVIGSLMHIKNCIIPYLAYSVSKLSRYSHNLGKDHWYALVRVLKHLKHTMNYGLHCHYTKYPRVIEGVCYTNWISNTSESKSISGYLFILNGVIVSWKSFTQVMNTHFTMEAKFVAINKVVEEI